MRVEVASAKRFGAYDFVVRVPLPLDLATQRTETFLRGLRSFFAPVRIEIEGRLFTCRVYRWPFADAEGQIVPNDAGTTDIMVHVGQWEVVIAYALLGLVGAELIAQVWRESWDFIVITLADAVVAYLIGSSRGPRFRQRLVDYFASIA